MKNWRHFHDALAWMVDINSTQNISLTRRKKCHHNLGCCKADIIMSDATLDENDPPERKQYQYLKLLLTLIQDTKTKSFVLAVDG